MRFGRIQPKTVLYSAIFLRQAFNIFHSHMEMDWNGICSAVQCNDLRHVWIKFSSAQLTFNYLLRCSHEIEPNCGVLRFEIVRVDSSLGIQMKTSDNFNWLKVKLDDLQHRRRIRDIDFLIKTWRTEFILPSILWCAVNRKSQLNAN